MHGDDLAAVAQRRDGPAHGDAGHPVLFGQFRLAGQPAVGREIISVGPSLPQAHAGAQVTVRVLEPDGTVVASLDFLNEEVSSGLRNQGLRAVGHDKSSGLVRLEMRMVAGEPPRGTLNIAVEDYVGRPPADVLPSLQFLD